MREQDYKNMLLEQGMFDVYRKSEYATIREVLSREFGVTDFMHIEEGVLDMPVQKVKDIMAKFKTKNPDKIERTVNQFKSMASKINTKDLKSKAMALAAKHGVDKKEYEKAEISIMNSIGVWIGGTVALTVWLPFTIIVIVIAVGITIAKKKKFSDVINDLIKQMDRGMRQTKPATTLEAAIELGGKATTWFLLGFIPPLTTIFWPIAGILGVVAMVWFYMGIFETVTK